jgi:CDP-diacylglycerol--glycerol-3-phosphate 3-phosphatidyltransferase
MTKSINRYNLIHSPIIPSTLTALRVISIPLIYWLTYTSISELITVYILACFTDLLDGTLARLLGSVTKSGALFDALADYLLIMTLLLYFVKIGVYPSWILLVVTLAFSQFALTFNKTMITDALGKHIGTLLYMAIGVTLMLPDSFVNHVLPYLITGYIILSIITRWKAIINR